MRGGRYGAVRREREGSVCVREREREREREGEREYGVSSAVELV